MNKDARVNGQVGDFRIAFGAIQVLIAIAGAVASILKAGEGDYESAVERVIITIALLVVVVLFSYATRDEKLSKPLSRLIFTVFSIGILIIFFNTVRQFILPKPVQSSFARIGCQKQTSKFPYGNGVDVQILQPDTVYYCKYRFSAGTEYKDIDEISSAEFNYRLLSYNNGITSTSDANVSDIWRKDGIKPQNSDTEVSGEIVKKDRIIMFGVFVKVNKNPSVKYVNMTTEVSIVTNKLLDDKKRLSDIGIPIAGS